MGEPLMGADCRLRDAGFTTEVTEVNRSDQILFVAAMVVWVIVYTALNLVLDKSAGQWVCG